MELLPLSPKNNEDAVRVSVNSFGYGGTNCHVILESLDQFVSGNKTNGNAVRPITNGTNGVNGSTNGINGTNGTHHEVKDFEMNGARSASCMPLVFPLSASSEAALNAMPGQIQDWLADRDVSESDLEDLSYTLACRRSQFKWRKAFVSSDLTQLKEALGEQKVSKTRAAPTAKIGFIFTGQGAQWAGMGIELNESSSVFRSAIEESSQILESLGCEWNLVQELGKQATEGSRINESELAQPVTTIIQMALVDMLAHYDVKPHFVAGHSSGEIAAAYAAGALTRQGAVIA